MQAIAGLIEQLQQQLNNLQGQYIAPVGCEVHTYSVKRPSGTYYYNKLTASEAIFEPSSKQEKVKVIHLSNNNDPRTEQAKLGIERRNQLTRVRTLLSNAVELFEEAANTLSQQSTVEDSSLLMTMDSTVSTDEASSNIGEQPVMFAVRYTYQSLRYFQLGYE
jgi:hypothetical protein